MEPGDSPFSQDSATWFHPEPDDPAHTLPSYFFTIHFDIILLFKPMYEMVFSLHVLGLQFIHFLISLTGTTSSSSIYSS
jgi:hypothetical protein